MIYSLKNLALPIMMNANSYIFLTHFVESGRIGQNRELKVQIICKNRGEEILRIQDHADNFLCISSCFLHPIFSPLPWKLFGSTLDDKIAK